MKTMILVALAVLSLGVGNAYAQGKPLSSHTGVYGSQTGRNRLCDRPKPVAIPDFHRGWVGRGLDRAGRSPATGETTCSVLFLLQLLLLAFWQRHIRVLLILFQQRRMTTSDPPRSLLRSNPHHQPPPGRRHQTQPPPLDWAGAKI